MRADGLRRSGGLDQATKSIKVAKEFEFRSHEDEVRYNDASQALTNWKRTAQELGKQVLTPYSRLIQMPCS